MAAVTTGDLDALLAVLDPDVAGEAELGGRAGPVGGFAGRARVARGALRFLGPGAGVTLVSVPTPHRPSILALRDGQVAAVVTLTIRDGVIEHIHGLADPARLAAITAALRG